MGIEKQPHPIYSEQQNDMMEIATYTMLISEETRPFAVNSLIKIWKIINQKITRNTVFIHRSRLNPGQVVTLQASKGPPIVA